MVPFAAAGAAVLGAAALPLRVAQPGLTTPGIFTDPGKTVVRPGRPAYGRTSGTGRSVKRGPDGSGGTREIPICTSGRTVAALGLPMPASGRTVEVLGLPRPASG